MKVRCIALLVLTVSFASSTISTAQSYHSNRQAKQKKIEEGGWKVAYGRELTETDAAKGAVATGVAVYTGDSKLLIAWAANLIEDSLEKMKKSISDEFSGEAKKKASEFVSKELKELLKPPSEGSKEKQFGEFKIKVGVAKYSGYYKIWVPNFSSRGGYSKKFNATFSYQPYVAVRYSKSGAPITSPMWDSIDAALFLSSNKIYFFKGDKYVRYDSNTSSADPGYPRKISSAWDGMTFTSGVDAAFATPDKEKIYFFKGKDYIRYDVSRRKADQGYPRKISDKWDGVSYDQIDAAFCRQVGKYAGDVYFFRGDNYTKYDMETRKGSNAGRKLGQKWEGKPIPWHSMPFKSNISAVLPTDDGRIYFFKDRKFYRYVDKDGTYTRSELTKNNSESFYGVFK